MGKLAINRQPSEAVVVQAAAAIYAANVAAGRVPEGGEKQAMEKAIREAIWIARTTDDALQSDNETW